ncbi:MAG: hypothetical protein AAB524_00375 [Patescibacteria group bacterium]
MIQISAHLTVHKDKMEKFKAAAAKCRALVEENEQGTNLSYDWFVDGDRCEVREVYAGSDAVQKHLENVGGALGELLEFSALTSLNVYGEPSEELTNALATLPTKIHTPLF